MQLSHEQLGGRLVAWSALVGVLALLAYGVRFSGGADDIDDPLYLYSTAISALFLYGMVLGLVLAIARGARPRELLALRRPASWPRALGLALLVLVGVGIVGTALEPFLQAGEEQGLTPSRWQPDRAGAFAANAVVVAGIAPVVEELTYRGLGFSLLERFGTVAAVVLVGLAFGLAHGLVEGLPILTAFGMGLAVLRSRTGSVYPPILVHAVFNALALAASLTF